ncbi:hydrogenase formation protein HypD [archaeon]|nr:hydrogenase formation protein HypD [archaeon]
MADFKDRLLAEKIVENIKKLASGKKFRFCHICGTHEYSITRHGLRSMLPENVEVVAGPGCPVCITPAAELDKAIKLANEGVILATFGDVVRVPGSSSSLAEARANGALVKIVYGPADAVDLAKNHPDKDVVFFATGFETTAPTTASVILSEPPKNFSSLVVHRTIPPAMEFMVGVGEHRFDGFIAPGHVSTIIGTKPYELFPRTYQMPTVVAGFEPTDVLMSILMLIKQIRDKDYKVENEYTRLVTEEGNPKALAAMDRAFETVGDNWRGIGRIPDSALHIREEYSDYDANKKYDIDIGKVQELDPKCSCHLVIVGKLYPKDCTMFAKACTPQRPRGPCMVSNEGTCSIAYRYGRD